MRLRTYDESALLERLAQLDRSAKTAFAASCAQRLLPLFQLYSRSAGTPELGSRLAAILDAAWAAASGVATDLELQAYQAEAEAMVPSDEDGWIPETAYGQNSAAAVAYAIRTWATDDPQEAAWAARQVYELADYRVLQRYPGLNLNAPDTEAQVLASDTVQEALAALAGALGAVESAPPTWEELREDAEADGQLWADAL